MINNINKIKKSCGGWMGGRKRQWRCELAVKTVNVHQSLNEEMQDDDQGNALSFTCSLGDYVDRFAALAGRSGPNQITAEKKWVIFFGLDHNSRDNELQSATDCMSRV